MTVIKAWRSNKVEAVLPSRSPGVPLFFCATGKFHYTFNFAIVHRPLDLITWKGLDTRGQESFYFKKVGKKFKVPLGIICS